MADQVPVEVEPETTPPRGEQTERTQRIEAVERRVNAWYRRFHPGWALGGMIVTFLTAFALVVLSWDHLATKAYVDQKIAELNGRIAAEHDIAVEVLGWQRAIGPALGIRAPALVQPVVPVTFERPPQDAGAQVKP